MFADIKTAWVIAGIGHGHEDVVTAEAAAAAASGGASGDVVAPAAVRQFQRITPDNIDSFHFHGSAGA